MTSLEYRQRLKDLDLTQEEAARVLRIHSRTSQNYATDKTKIPYAVEFMLNELSPKQAKEMSADAH